MLHRLASAGKVAIVVNPAMLAASVGYALCFWQARNLELVVESDALKLN
jgi:hypothetical protein